MRSQPFDLKKLDYETNRKELRRKLLKRSIAPACIIGLLAIWFLLPSILTPITIDKYDDKDYGSARAWFTPLVIASPERFVADFNSGTIDTKLGEFERAEQELGRALAFAPEGKICMVAQNLAVSHILHADSLVGPAQAKIYDNKATELIEKYPECFEGGTSGGGGGGGSSSSANANSLSKSQQQQLDQKEQKGRDRQEQYARDEEFDPSKPQLKPW